MVKLVFIDNAGCESTVDAVLGQSVMEAAVDNGLPGIVGECGGKMVCGTCHVFVTSGPWADPTDIDDAEDDMLDYTASLRRSGSRLSCQLLVTDERDGTVLQLPATQVT